MQRIDFVLKKLTPRRRNTNNPWRNIVQSASSSSSMDLDLMNMELEDATGFTFSEKSVELRLIEDSSSQDSQEQEQELHFLPPEDYYTRQIYNSPTIGFSTRVATENSEISTDFSDMTSVDRDEPQVDLFEGGLGLGTPFEEDGGGEGGRYRRRKCFGGVRACLLFTMGAFVLTIIVAVTTIYVLDNTEVGNGSSPTSFTSAPLIGRPPSTGTRIVYNPMVFPLSDIAELTEHDHDHDPDDEPHFLQDHSENEVSALLSTSYELALVNFRTDYERRNSNEETAKELHLWNFNRSSDNLLSFSEKERLLTEHGLVMELAYEDICQRMNFSIDEADEGMILENMSLSREACPKPDKMVPEGCFIEETVRSLDGTCNNFKHPEWGSVFQPYRRLAFPHYENGISAPRAFGVHDDRLPSPRVVSQNMHLDEYRVDSGVSSMLPLWAHFISHDIMYTAKFPKEIAEDCCKNASTSSEDGDEASSSCLPIEIPSDDPFYSERNVSCLEYSRSAPYGNCHFGPREQFNRQTSFIDGSHIYGNSEEVSSTLRLKDPTKNGNMRLYDFDGLYLLPLLNDTKEFCTINEEQVPVPENTYCFIGGDSRVNDVVTITAMQTIWVRHHNQIANALSDLNSHWDDDKVFEETRRIVIAQLQLITFKEYLPLLLNPDLLSSGDLLLLSGEGDGDTYYQEFDVDTNPGLSNEFVIASQFFWSMVQGLMKRLDPSRNREDFKQFTGQVLNPFLLWKEGEIDKILLGASSQAAAKLDAYVSGQLTNHMYQNPQNNFGTDIVALIIQQGRDHGLPPYIDLAKRCSSNSDRFKEVKQFSDLQGIWEADALARVQSVFEFVEDVDLFTGLLSERPQRGGRVGPTLGCILTDQFSRLRKGDMFWFEGDNRPNHFDTEQLKAIRGTTLAKILCQNSDKIRTIQSSVLLLPNDRSNPVVHCSQIPKVRFDAWKESTKNDDHHDDDYLGIESVESVHSAEHFKGHGTGLGHDLTPRQVRARREFEILKADS